MFRILSIIAIALYFGCGSSSAGGAKLELDVAQLTLPAGGNWSKPEFRPEIGSLMSFKQVAPKHSIVAMLREQVGFDNQTAFILRSQPMILLEHRVQSVREELGSGRFEVKSFETETKTYAKATCIGFVSTARDLWVENDFGEFFEFRAEGYVCVARAYPAILEFDYSERWDPRTDAHAAFHSEARAFFDSLVIADP